MPHLQPSGLSLAALPLLLASACGPTPKAAEPRHCNGSAYLCDRPFDEVSLPATHNSMSNADDGWDIPNQQHDMARQLDDGIRGMLFDTHDWDGAPYLCHAYCEFGAIPMDEAMDQIATFLDDNPDEVLAFVIEDAISADETASVFAETGLDGFVYTHPEGEPWPTLGEMIDGGTRVLVTAESGGPPPVWYQHAWDLYWDTPFDFTAVADFNCDLNREATTNDLFLVNHWLGPLPSTDRADEANTAAVLGGRVADCQAQWAHIPNLVAVDFYDRGDLFSVVDGLNGI